MRSHCMRERHSSGQLNWQSTGKRCDPAPAGLRVTSSQFSAKVNFEKSWEKRMGVQAADWAPGDQDGCRDLQAGRSVDNLSACCFIFLKTVLINPGHLCFLISLPSFSVLFCRE